MTGTFQVDSSRPMKHVSRKDLYTSLETRIAYLHDFLDFNSSTTVPEGNLRPI